MGHPELCTQLAETTYGQIQFPVRQFIKHSYWTSRYESTTKYVCSAALLKEPCTYLRLPHCDSGPMLALSTIPLGANRI